MSRRPVVSFSPQFKADSPRELARLRALGPVHRAELSPGFEVWAVVGAETARVALTHPALLKDSEPSAAMLDAIGYTLNKPGVGLGGNMLESDPPEHSRLRRLVAGAFSPRRVQALAPRVQRIADDLLDALDGVRETDLVASYTAPLPVTVICELLGVPEGERDGFREWTVVMLGPPSDPQRAAAMRLNQYLGGLIERKRAAPGDDLLSALIEAQTAEDGRLSPAELQGTAALLVVAGHDTTVNLLGNAVVALLHRPGQADLLRKNPELIEGAVEEFLRFDPSVEQSTKRYAAADFDLAGTAIRRGDVVVVMLGSASRDTPQPDAADPATLDVTRTAARHLAFGHGIHYCLGAPLARLEAAIGLGTLLRRFPDLHTAAPLSGLEWVPTGIMRGPRRLPVRLTLPPR